MAGRRVEAPREADGARRRVGPGGGAGGHHAGRRLRGALGGDRDRLRRGRLCYGAVLLKNRFGYDDSLDAFGVHGVGGLAGALLTGVFAQKVLNDAGADGALFGNLHQLGVQGLACAVDGGLRRAC